MKKIFIFIAASLLLVNIGMAQKGIAFGLRVIPTMNWVSATPENKDYAVESAGIKGGIAFGPSLRYGFSKNFNADLSAIFSWQQFAINQQGKTKLLPVVNNTENFKLQYFQLPLNTNAQFEVADNLNILINFGLGINVKLKDVRKVDYNVNYNPLIFPNKPDSEYRETKVLMPIDVFLMAGAGVGYDFGDNLHLTLTIQYQNGLLDGWQDKKNNDGNDRVSLIGNDELKINHRSVNFNLGFFIDF